MRQECYFQIWNYVKRPLSDSHYQPQYCASINTSSVETPEHWEQLNEWYIHSPIHIYQSSPNHRSLSITCAGLKQVICPPKSAGYQACEAQFLLSNVIQCYLQSFATGTDLAISDVIGRSKPNPTVAIYLHLPRHTQAYYMLTASGSAML